MVPMPEQKAQLEEVLKMTNFIFDHKGVQIVELNFKGKRKKECFYIRSSNSQVTTSKNTFSKLNTPHSDVLYEKKELNYLSTQGRNFQLHLQYGEELISSTPLLSTYPI